MNPPATDCGHRTPADARRAASLMLLRDGADGLEVLMLRRAEREGDLRSGAVVFPGGVLDEADRAARGLCLGWDEPAANARLALADGALDYFIAAVRECFEEVGVLLAARPDGTAFDAAAHAELLHPWRGRLARGEASIVALCEAMDLRLDLRGLHYHSHWLTPPGIAQRFDTRFFVVPAPPGQRPQADRGEALELMWRTPAAALDPAAGLRLLPVTRRTLQDLGRFECAAAAHAEAGRRERVALNMPRRVAGDGPGLQVVMPGEFAYDEVARLDPQGRGTASARIVAGRAVQLSARVWRVTAPNPGVMTGPGTNSYLVGEPQGAGGWTVIDPGPDDPRHRQALLAAAPGPITRILVSHTHVDHSPGAAALKAATGASVLGWPAPASPGHDRGFAPDRQPAHGERIELGPSTTLRVLHTPGHASNHLCFLLEQEATLFTGDHVMQGSTVVINPPDGDMAAYVRALQGLLEQPLEWLAPGHGFLVARPQELLRSLIAHRLGREDKVVQALRRAAPATAPALVEAVYADVPPARHALAARSLLAHLLKLQADGRAVVDAAGLWRPC